MTRTAGSVSASVSRMDSVLSVLPSLTTTISCGIDSRLSVAVIPVTVSAMHPSSFLAGITTDSIIVFADSFIVLAGWLELRVMKALITGSGGLIGSECVRLLGEQGWDIIGVDNDMRQFFFGAAGSTNETTAYLKETVPTFRHQPIDIRNRQAVRDLFEAERPDFVIHTAAQPSHDKAASIPCEDFDVNAGGTMNLLVAARDFCRESPFCFTSTNKVYGDRPNYLPLVEQEKRFDYANGLDGIDEGMSVNHG